MELTAKSFVSNASMQPKATLLANFTLEDAKKDCPSVLHMIELLIITSFTNTKLEISWIGRAKNDWMTLLTQKLVENLLRISEEGSSIDDFKSEQAINLLYNTAVQMLGCRPHTYPTKKGR